MKMGSLTSSHKWKRSVILGSHCVCRLQHLRRRTKGNESSHSLQETVWYRTPLASDGTLGQYQITSALKLLYPDSTIEGAYRNPELAAWLMGVQPELKSIILESVETVSNMKRDRSSQKSSKQ